MENPKGGLGSELPISGSGGLVPDPFFTRAAANLVAVPADGAQHNVGVVIPAPPAWIDGVGNILLPGLYLAVVDISASVAFTTPGLFVFVGSGLTGQWVIPIDSLVPAAGCSPFFVGSAVLADAPLQANPFLVMPTDVTGELHATVNYLRLAH